MYEIVRSLRPFVPGVLWIFFRRVRNYFRRLALLWEVAKTIQGVSFSDRNVVRRSLLFGPVGLLKNLDDWRAPVLISNATVTSRDLGVFFVRSHTDDLAHVLPSQDPAVYGAVASLVGKGDVVIDGGANLGGVSVLAARRAGELGKVISIEMHPETFASLRRNIELNQLENVQLIGKALSSSSGQKISARVSGTQFGQATIAPKVPSDNGSEKSSFVVETITLDDLIQHIESVALLKLDLEGHEMEALKGARRLLGISKYVIFESWSGSDSAVFGLLSSRGFTISKLGSRNFLATKA